jgi:hypothetical protein
VAIEVKPKIIELAMPHARKTPFKKRRKRNLRENKTKQKDSKQMKNKNKKHSGINLFERS